MRAASRRSSGACEASDTTRRRELPSGTVGGRIAWANAPRRRAASQSAVAESGAPTTSGMIGIVPGSTAKPCPASSARSNRAFSCARETISGRAASRCSASRAAPSEGGGRAVEKISVRARLTRKAAVVASQHTNAP